MEINRAILRTIFEKDYNLLEAENGEQAIMLVKQYHAQIAAMLLDIVMPEKNGYQVMDEVGRMGFLPEFPIVVITAENTSESEVRAFDLGASDMIVKPFEPHVVKRRVQNNIELNLHKQNQDELIEEQASKLRESNAVMIDALSSIIEYRSVETGRHIQRIRMFTKILLEDVASSYPEFMLDKRKIEIIVSASSMHDIGKIAIPDAILNKPGRLTTEEFDIMKTHSIKGCEMIASLSRMTDKEYLLFAYNICRYHHERWDGAGYPDGLKGDNIPVCAQVVGVADCYDALTTDRVYRKAIPTAQAINMILNGECGIFSPKLLESLKNVQGMFAQLSKDYADAPSVLNPPEQPEAAALPTSMGGGMLDTLRMGQLKYFTLLKYIDATVMEVDFLTGMHHVVYTSDDNFDLLRSGSQFIDSFKAFVEAEVCPEDRDVLLASTDKYIEHFFQEGLTRRNRRYRVFDHLDKKYCWYQAAILRIDAEDPNVRKVMIIWQKEKSENTMLHSAGNIPANLLNCIQLCKNDKWFTLLSISEQLQNLTGFNAVDIHDVFHNHLIELIRPAERKEIFHSLNEQLCHGTMVELEYPIASQKGSLVWFLDKRQLITNSDGEEIFYCMLIDITQSKKALEEMRRLDERHRIIMEQTNDIIFEWDVCQDQIVYSDNCEKKLGYRLLNNQFRARLDTASHIHPEDTGAVEELLDALKGGKPYGETELRLVGFNGMYCWYKLRASGQRGNDGKVYKVVGVVTDINEEKQRLKVWYATPK